MTEQIEMMHSAEPAAALHPERDVLAPAALPVRAGGLNEQVAEYRTERAAGIAGDRGTDRIVVRTGQQRRFVPMIPQAAVLVTAGPVIGQQVAVAQILDAGARAVDHRRKWPGLGHLAEDPARETGGAGQRCAQVR